MYEYIIYIYIHIPAVCHAWQIYVVIGPGFTYARATLVVASAVASAVASPVHAVGVDHSVC